MANLQISSVDEALIQNRIAQVRAEIPASVEIMAVSKGSSSNQIRVAYRAGIRHFGESRVQEAQTKQAELEDCPEIIWHLIGHLQTNKAKQALQLFDWIDSVDSWKLAQSLNQRAWDLQIRPKLCLQVKLAPDPDKYGWSISELLQTLPQFNQLSQLDVQGLMTILPLGLSDDEILNLFKKLTELARHICSIGYEHITPQVISMGMSDDYRLAIVAGATIIRLGRSLFAETVITS